MLTPRLEEAQGSPPGEHVMQPSDITEREMLPQPQGFLLFSLGPSCMAVSRQQGLESPEGLAGSRGGLSSSPRGLRALPCGYLCHPHGTVVSGGWTFHVAAVFRQSGCSKRTRPKLQRFLCLSLERLAVSSGPTTQGHGCQRCNRWWAHL